MTEHQCDEREVLARLDQAIAAARRQGREVPPHWLAEREAALRRLGVEVAPESEAEAAVAAGEGGGPVVV